MVNKKELIQLEIESVEQILKGFKETEVFSYSKTKMLMRKVITIYSAKLAAFVRKFEIIEEIEKSKKKEPIRINKE